MNYAVTLLTSWRELWIIRYCITKIKYNLKKGIKNNYTSIMFSCQGLFNLLVIWFLDAS
jgi:hypothetical protein